MSIDSTKPICSQAGVLSKVLPAEQLAGVRPDVCNRCRLGAAALPVGQQRNAGEAEE
jgi:hypothetical protein